MKHRNLRLGWTLAVTFSIWAAVAAAEQNSAAPVVAELFTSQGCSSCPPAEAVLGELAARSDVLPLAFHVTYWNDLGWRDRFSLAEADTRQYRYASILGKHGVYTPQLIVNGGRNVLGSNRNAVLRALADAPRPAAIRLTLSSDTIQVEFPQLQGGCDCTVVLLGVQPAAQTAVGQGENAGRSLREFNIVRLIEAQANWNGSAVLHKALLPKLPHEVSLVVLLAQRRADARVMAVGLMSASRR